jgi:hypothetical protein
MFSAFRHLPLAVIGLGAYRTKYLCVAPYHGMALWPREFPDKSSIDYKLTNKVCKPQQRDEKRRSPNG